MDTMQAPPNVLIVDDEPIVRFALCRALQGEKYRIHEAADGEEALRMVQAINPDIVFLDIMIPKVNGLDVVKRVKESCRTKGIPVVIVSVLSNQEDKFRALEAGAEGYIAKPPHPVEVG
ncbi:MAG: response regulator, partial [Deltaproteobacteria bacterium]|nr:response regulator [Deltaproteobacteria bacterium]